MEANITKEEWQETNRKLEEWFQKTEQETLAKMPMWMRMNYFCNKLFKVLKDGHKDEEIKWNYINEMCKKDLDAFDYNMYHDVTTVSDFESQRFDIICASEGVGPWHKHTCKDCGKEFYMTFKEVHFYKDKNLNLPKRCKECRDKRKGVVQK